MTNLETKLLPETLQEQLIEVLNACISGTIIERENLEIGITQPKTGE
jgi:hypothetical protein